MIIIAAMVGALLILCSSIGTLMLVFLGGGGPELRALLDFQLGAAALGWVAILLVLARIISKYGIRIGAQNLFDAMPGWMIRSAMGVVLLVVAGELSLYLIANQTGLQISDGAHGPLITAVSSTLAFCALYVYQQLAVKIS